MIKQAERFILSACFLDYRLTIVHPIFNNMQQSALTEKLGLIFLHYSSVDCLFITLPYEVCPLLHYLSGKPF